jgi:uncharacterized protein YndB with AHSA1/START domain
MAAVEGKNTSQVNENVITIERVFNAPKESLFAMFSNAENLAQWWGPTEWPATIVTFNFAPGGVCHYYMHGPDGTKAWGLMKIVDIKEPDMLVFKDMFSDEQGNVSEELPQGDITFTFVEEDGKTTLTMTGQYGSVEDTKKLVEMQMLDGMADTWNQLARLVEPAQ